MTRPFVYLDYHASTPLLPSVLQVMNEAMAVFGNPSSMHRMGRDAKELLESSRVMIADAIGAKSSQVIFTSGATESNNAVLWQVAFGALQHSGRSHLIISGVEHSSIRVTAQRLAALGVSVSVAPVDANGVVNVDALAELIRPETALISVMLGNNETGVIQPVSDVVAMARDNDSLVHCDAAQCLGKTPIDVSSLGVDYMSFSGHKCYAPKGIGALYVRRDDGFHPLLTGGAHERVLRAGTENLASIAGFGHAAQLACSELDQRSEHLTHLVSQFESDVVSSIEDVVVNGEGDRLPGISNLSFLGVDGYGLAMNLDLDGIGVSTGSACSTGSFEPSPVLEAMGLSDDRIRSAIRFSFGVPSTVEDASYTAECLRSIVARMRQVS